MRLRSNLFFVLAVCWQVSMLPDKLGSMLNSWYLVSIQATLFFPCAVIIAWSLRDNNFQQWPPSLSIHPHTPRNWLAGSSKRNSSGDTRYAPSHTARPTPFPPAESPN